MKSRYSKDLAYAFVVRKEDIEKICSLFSKRVGNLEITAHCADDVDRTFSTAKELLHYENPKEKRIARLCIRAKSDDYEKMAEIDFYGSVIRGISIELSASDQVVTHLRSDLLDIVSGTRPWYDLVARAVGMSIGWLGPLAIILLVLSFAFLMPWTFSVLHLDSPDRTLSTSVANALMGVIGFALYVASICGGFRLDRLGKYLFPFSTFLIGQGNKRYNHHEWIRKGVVISFLVSVCAGIFVLVLTTRRVSDVKTGAEPEQSKPNATAQD